MLSRMWRGKREWIARHAERCGLTTLLERLPAAPALLVLNHHRVGDRERCLYDRGVFEATADEFDERVALLKSRFPLVGLDEAQAIIEGRHASRHVKILLTFDDGYRDSYETVFPILRSHGVPAVFFLPTAFIETGRIPWWDQIAFMMRHTDRVRITLRYPRPWVADFARVDRESAIRQVLQLYKAPETADPARLLAEVAEACAVPPPREAESRLFLEWEEARALLRGGMAIGSHTHSHELLARLPVEKQREELRLSREILESHLSIRIETLAYPVGSRTSFSPTTWQVLEETAYRTAFSYYGGVNRAASPRFDVRRMSISRGTSPAYLRLRIASAALARRELV